MVRAGATLQEAGDAVGVSRQRVKQVLDAIGETEHHGRTHVSMVEKACACCGLVESVTATQAGKSGQTCKSEACLAWSRKEMGRKTSKALLALRAPSMKRRRRRVRSLKARGKTLDEMAAALGVSRMTIVYDLYALGLVKPRCDREERLRAAVRASLKRGGTYKGTSEATGVSRTMVKVIALEMRSPA